jgi:hypothetical protein
MLSVPGTAQCIRVFTKLDHFEVKNKNFVVISEGFCFPVQFKSTNTKTHFFEPEITKEKCDFSCHTKQRIPR